MHDLLKEFVASGQGKGSDPGAFMATLPPSRLGGYGGNTPCVEIETGKIQVIVDAGSGIRNLGYELMQGECGKGRGEAHIFFTHFHWDHLIGLPFFTPIFIPGNVIHVYAVQPELESVFHTVFRKPFFPVPFESLGARVVFHRLAPRAPFKIGDLSLTPYELDHPDPCWGYRIESGGKAIAYCVDTECIRLSREELGPDLALYQNADLMIFDAQYTLKESLEKVHWGHSTALCGLDIAMREGIRKVLFMHWDPAASDEQIELAETQARLYYQNQLRTSQRRGQPVGQVEWTFAREGSCIEV